MDEQEYMDKLREICLEYDTKKKALVKEFALSNNQVKAGDVVKDKLGAIEVTAVSIGWTSAGLPCCVYLGKILTKKGVPNKRGETRAIYQGNVIED